MMTRLARGAAGLLLVALVSMGVAGCMEGDTTYGSDLESEVLDYLERSYETEFVVDQSVPASNAFTGHTYDIVTVHAIDDPSHPFEVHRVVQESGDVGFSDGYGLALAERAIEASLQPVWADWRGARIAVRFKTSDGVTSSYRPSEQFDMAELVASERDRATALVWVFVDASEPLDTSREAALIARMADESIQAGSLPTDYWGMGVFFLEPTELTGLDPRSYARMDYLDVKRLSKAKQAVLLDSSELVTANSVTEADVLRAIGE